MLTLAAIIPSLNEGNWYAVLGLEDTRPVHRRFFCFIVGLEPFQYSVALQPINCIKRLAKGSCSGSEAPALTMQTNISLDD